jgi:sec-independent protein translocase protein TatC
MSAALARQVDPEPDEQRETVPDGSMSFLDHLDEFRTRLIRSAIAIAIGMAGTFFFVGQIFDFVFEPTRRVLPAGSTLIFNQPGEAFSLEITLALIAGVIVASPFVFWQVWLFIAPALRAREKKFAVPFVLLSSTGCVAGGAFAHYVLFPYMIAFFATFNTPRLVFMPRVSDVFDLYVRTVLAMMVVFQMPTLAFFLARFGMLTAGWLVRNFRYAVLVIFIVAAVLTPSADPWNQTIFALPMILLYGISIVIAWGFGPRRARRDA